MHQVSIPSLSIVCMTSLELVDFINSQRGPDEAALRHDHFMAKVPKVIGEEAAPNFRGSYKGQDNSERPCYVFPKREACLMAMSYSYDLQAKVFDRMTELEQGQAKPAFRIPSTLSEALRLAADQADMIAAQTEQLAMAAPKVEFVDKYVQAATGAMSFRQVCKMLAIKESVFRAFLKDQGVMYRLGSDWAPYSKHLDAGRFKTTAGVADHGDASHAFTQAKFTSKGVEWIAAEWAKHQVAQHRASMLPA